MVKPDEPRPCNKGCGVDITLSDKSGRWLPYGPDGEPHKCPGEQGVKTFIPQKKEDLPLHPKGNHMESYYAGVTKLAELNLAEANVQLAGGWELLRIIEKKSLRIVQGTPTPDMVSEIVYIVGKRA